LVKDGVIGLFCVKKGASSKMQSLIFQMQDKMAILATLWPNVVKCRFK